MCFNSTFSHKTRGSGKIEYLTFTKYKENDVDKDVNDEVTKKNEIEYVPFNIYLNYANFFFNNAWVSCNNMKHLKNCHYYISYTYV